MSLTLESFVKKSRLVHGILALSEVAELTNLPLSHIIKLYNKGTFSDSLTLNNNLNNNHLNSNSKTAFTYPIFCVSAYSVVQFMRSENMLVPPELEVLSQRYLLRVCNQTNLSPAP